MKSFVCSLCHNGIVGGGLYLDSQSLTYKTNKLTVGKKIQKFSFADAGNKRNLLEVDSLSNCNS